MCESRFKAQGKATLIMLPGLIYLTACTLVGLYSTPTPTAIQDPDLIDRSWLTGDPCLPPCWYGMEVGKTTIEEAFRRVHYLSFIDSNSITKGESNWYFPSTSEVVPAKGMGLYYHQPENEISARMWFVEDVLVDIFLFPNYTVSFPEAVDLLGEPDFVGVDPTMRTACTISLIWMKNQLRIYHTEQYRDVKRRLCQLVTVSGYKIPKDLVVKDVWIGSKERFVDFPGWMHEPWQGFIEP